MTEQEYLKNVEELEIKYKTDLYNLAKDYAMSNSKIKIGDIIATRNSIIKVEKIIVQPDIEFPYCKYKGSKLTKNLEPYKNNDQDTIFQSEKFLIIE